MKRKLSLVVHGGSLAILAALLFPSAAFATGPEEWVVFSILPYYGSLYVDETQGPLMVDKAGNIYGTIYAGGTFEAGFAYELVRPVPPKTEWTQTVIYNFTGANGDTTPLGALTMDAAGNLYGTTSGGVEYPGHGGTVFELMPPATEGAEWTEVVLHTFQGWPTDGGSPGSSGVVFDGMGRLYGVTKSGGTSDYKPCSGTGCGAAYQLTPPAVPGGAWTESLIHSFYRLRNGGPTGTPVWDDKGNLFGGTFAGEVYRLTPPAAEGGVWGYKEIYDVPGNDYFKGNLTFHNNGRIYGAGEFGGKYGQGFVFELVPPPPGGSWTENDIYDFDTANASYGAQPLGTVIFDKLGNLYGATALGGSGNVANYCTGCGTVYELSPPATEGGAWTFTLLHSFPATPDDGYIPVSDLIFAKDDALIGLTGTGGTQSRGTVFGVIK